MPWKSKLLGIKYLGLLDPGQAGASVAEDAHSLHCPALPADTLQDLGLPAVMEARGSCFRLPQAEQVERALTGSSVFPFPCPDPVPNQRVTKAFKLHTRGEVSQNPHFQARRFYTLKTAKRELATSEGHSSWRPLGCWHQGPPRQPLPPSLPVTVLGCLSPSKSGRGLGLPSHHLLCNPRQAPCPL